MLVAVPVPAFPTASSPSTRFLALSAARDPYLVLD
jgi:hypothetical protein